MRMFEDTAPDKVVRARQLIASSLNVREAARVKVSKSGLYTL